MRRRRAHTGRADSAAPAAFADDTIRTRARRRVDAGGRRFWSNGRSEGACPRCGPLQMRKIVVLFQVSLCLGDDRGELSPQRWSLDALDFTIEIDLAVPDFERRESGETADMDAVGFRRACRERSRAPF